MVTFVGNPAAVVYVPPDPPPVDPPDPTPDPGDPPFDAPVTTHTVNVPDGYNTTQLNNLIDASGDGVEFVFASGGHYNLSSGIRITNCHDLIFDLNGATLQMSGSGGNQLTSPFLIGWSYGGGYWTGVASHIQIKDGTLVGSASPAGVGGQGEEQAGIKSHSAQYVEVTGCTIRAVTGDAFQVEVTNSAHHWYHDNVIESCGRNGLTVGGGSDILCEDNEFQAVGYFTLDLEPTPGYPAEINGVTFRNNDPCDWTVWGGNGGGFFSVDGSHTGYPIDNVTVSGNTVTGGSLYTQFDNGNRGRNATVEFTDNESTGGSVAGPVLYFKYIDGLTVTGNTQALSSGSLVSTTSCTDTVTSPNP